MHRPSFRTVHRTIYSVILNSAQTILPSSLQNSTLCYIYSALTNLPNSPQNRTLCYIYSAQTILPNSLQNSTLCYINSAQAILPSSAQNRTLCYINSAQTILPNSAHNFILFYSVKTILKKQCTFFFYSAHETGHSFQQCTELSSLSFYSAQNWTLQ